MAKKKKKSKKENSLRTFKDLHSAIADLAAHYIPRNQLKDYFAPDVLNSVQKKPTYHATPDEKGLIERVVFRLVEKKDKIDGEGEASASESILRAARDDIPKILVEAEDLAGIDPSNINPHNVQPFLKNAAKTIAAYLLDNEARLRKYDEEAFIDALNNIFSIGEHVETQVRHACKRKINQLEAALHDAEAENAVLEAEKAAEPDTDIPEEYVVKLEADNAALRAEKEKLEQEQSEFGPAYNDIAKENTALTARASSLEEDITGLRQEIADLRKDYDADLQELAKANDKLTSLEDEKARLRTDFAKKIKDKQAELKKLQERVMFAEKDKDARAKEVKELQERVMFAEHDREKIEVYEQEIAVYEQELLALQKQLSEADDDIFKLSEKSALLEQERDEAKEDSAQMQEAYDALFAQYRARIDELGSSVAEWYAFVENTLLKNTELCKNDAVKGLRAKNTELAALVTDLMEEAKSGKRVAEGTRQDVSAPWKEEEPEEASTPTLEAADDTYKQMLGKVKSEHCRQIWGWMHLVQDMPDSAYSAEQKLEVYKRFLATKPKDASIQGIIHCNIGKILYKSKKDYANARAAFVKAVEHGKQELQERPEDKEVQERVALYQKNIRACNKKLAA
ncbi:hypothetical protein KY338_05440 [Candidatus Woesearchaeota archaeon]|nr:hypothetical protein [Candidatus Woesearchaeota archaeon]MBW3006346.1 hypothetical protein [Candidatus Woesearchaeota archaeon]